MPAATAPTLTFPALFTSADTSSNDHQRQFLNLLRAEYGLLFVAAVFSMNLSTSAWYYALFACVFAGTLVCLFLRSKKPEQDWYKCRALAESVKTSTWRYAMRADPFGGASAPAKAEFIKYLGQVLSSNQQIGEKISGKDASGSQTTPEMETIRGLAWNARRAVYLDQRVGDQRGWYSRKAQVNRRLGRRWAWISFGIYAAAFALVLYRVVDPTWSTLPIEPLIVAGSIVVGWSQVKKFNELASTYTLTAHEIGLLEAKISDVENETEFGEFVNEAEQAFSREHTQWVARQTHKF